MTAQPTQQEREKAREICARMKSRGGNYVANGHLESDIAQALADARADGIEAAANAKVIRHEQWEIVSKAIERYSAGEISDLHALGLIANGFMALDAARDEALAKGEG